MNTPETDANLVALRKRSGFGKMWRGLIENPIKAPPAPPLVPDAAVLMEAAGKARTLGAVRVQLEVHHQQALAKMASAQESIQRAADFIRGRELHRLRVFKCDYAGATYWVVTSRAIGIRPHLEAAGLEPESDADAEQDLEELPDDTLLPMRQDDGTELTRTAREWIESDGPGVLMCTDW